MRLPPEQRVKDWSELPLVMSIDDIVRLTGIPKGTIENRCYRRVKTCGGPINFASKPREWYREHVRAFYERGDALPVALPSRRKPFDNVIAIKDEKARLAKAAGL